MMLKVMVKYKILLYPKVIIQCLQILWILSQTVFFMLEPLPL
uniref:Uncharacterized protein n=1 Tax=Bacteriophage sp. TaxID=38018 RepID=A0A8D9UHR2_9VIRU|nr:MAG TPA: hypothetical protein [Bacteriophage sp.]